MNSGDKQKTVLVVLAPYSDAVRDLLAVQGKRDDLEILEAPNPDEAVNLIAGSLPCMFIGSVVDNQSIPGVVSALKRSNMGIKYGRLKTMVISKLKNKQLGNLVGSLGVTDYMEEPVPARTLVFKSNVQIKAVETVKKQEEAKKKSSEKMVFKTDAEAAAAAAGQPAGTNHKPALQIESDMFLFKNGAARKAGKKFVVDLDGPDPASGEWVQHEDKGDAKTAWRWVPTDEKEKPEVKNGDGWVHEGDKPVFNPSTRKWQLASEKPDLSYQKDKKKAATKIATNAQGELDVAADSPKAAENLKAITAKWNPAALTPEEKKLGASLASSAAPDSAKGAQNNLSSMNLVQKDSPQGEFHNKTGTSEAKPESKDLSYTGSTLPESKELSLKDKKKQADEAEELVLKNRKKKPQRGSGGQEGSGESEVSGDDEADAQGKIPAAGETSPSKANPALAFLQKKKEEASAHQDKKSASGWKEEKGEFHDKTAGSKGEIHTAPSDKRKKSETDREIAASGKKERKPRDPGESKADRLKRLMQDLEAGDTESAPEEEIGASTGREKKKKAGGESTKDKLDRLRKMLEEDKKSLTQELTEELSRPIPDTLSPEEEAETRKELGITDPNITPKELARKKKFHKLKNLKDKLKDFDADIADAAAEAEKPDPKIHDLKPDETENTWSQKDLAGQSGRQRKLNAYDSDVSDEELAEQERKKSLLGKDSKKDRDDKVKEPEFFRKESEILPLGGAWESSGFHFVYLDALTRYKGFSTVESLLPLWIYEGERIPELLSKTKEWRFFSREPVQAKEMSQVPIEVVDFLKSFNEQIKKGEGKKKDDKSDRLAALKDRLGDGESDRRGEVDASSELGKSSEEHAEVTEGEISSSKKPRTMADKAAELEDRKKTLREKVDAGKSAYAADETEKKKKRDTETKADRLAALKDRLGGGEKTDAAHDDEVEDSLDASEEGNESDSAEEIQKKSRKDDKSDRLAALKDRLGKGDKRHAEEDGETSEDHSRPGEDPGEESTGQSAAGKPKKRDREKESKADRLAALKQKLGDTGEDEEEKTEGGADSGDGTDAESAADSGSSETLGTDAGTNAGASPGKANKIEEALSTQSPAMKKFFERRKKKSEAGAAGTSAVIESKPRDQGGPVAYLGIYVALSDAVYNNKEFPRTAVRMAKAISIAIENSFATFVRARDPSGSDAEVMGSSNLQHPVGTVMNVKAAPRIPFELKDSQGAVMGWLVIEPSPPRTELTLNESDAVEKAASKVAQLWEARENEEKSREKKAA